MYAEITYGICLPYLMRSEKAVETLWLDCGNIAQITLCGMEKKKEQ